MPTWSAYMRGRFVVCLYLLIYLSGIWAGPFMSAQTTIYSANFETTTGDNAWQLLGAASDGNWIIGTPNPYQTNGVQMELDAVEGTGALLTGNGNIQDVDDGPTIARSPDINIPSGTTSISFFSMIASYTNSGPDDIFLFEVRRSADDAPLLTMFSGVGSSAGMDAQWVNNTVDLSSLANETVYLMAYAIDDGTPSKFEAALDLIIMTNLPPAMTMCDTVVQDGFESGLGNWDDGGADSERLFNPAFSATGDFSIGLRDNTNTSTTTSVSLDLSGADTVIVSFNYYPISMEPREDFWLQISEDNGVFTTIQTWARGTDFNNDSFYSDEVKIVGPLSDDTRFRFRCDASSNGDLVFIDDIIITECMESLSACSFVDISDAIYCNDEDITITAVVTDTSIQINSQQWTDLGTGTATGVTLVNPNDQTLLLNTSAATTGTIYIAYEGVTDSCTDRDTVLIQILADPTCAILTDRDTICSSEILTMSADTNYLVTPVSGMVDASSGVGTTIDHQIIGVEDPASTIVTITLPTWDDHFDQTLLNGQQILPEVFETASYNAGGMNCQTPWVANVNGLPRSIIEITATGVRYFSSLTPNSTVMTEVYPTNWTTTPQPFIQGTNVLRFGVQNTAGPVGGSWTIEAVSNLSYSYLWSTGETTPSITVSPMTTTTYDLTIISPSGCSSTCQKTIYVGQGYEETITYEGCTGDGYAVELYGNTYDESNPTDTVIVPTSLGCDSIYYIDLNYGQEPIVEAGEFPASLCSNGTLNLSDLGASISGGVSTGMWSSTGGGTFDNGGIFGGAIAATSYTPSVSEIESGKIILTLTSDDPPTSCSPAADAVMILIENVTCSQFPWAGGN